MTLALLAAQVALAAVFVTAAITKLADREGARRAMGEFGVPGRLVRPLAALLPLVELATAAALLPDSTARWGAGASLALLLAFSAAIALNLSRGRAPDCHCFGRLHSAPVSWWTVARNLLLALVAAGLAWGPAPAWLLLTMVAAALGVTVLERLRSSRESAPGLPVGSEAPEFRLSALDGAVVSLAGLRERGQPVLLVFSDAHCGPCAALAPDVARWQRELDETLTIAVIERGHERAGPAADPYGRADVLLQEDDEVARAYGANGTPSAVLVGAQGTVASPLVGGPVRIEGLLESVRGVPARPAAARGRGLTRLELVARAGAVTLAVLAGGARDALAGAVPIPIECKYVRCGNRCCPKKAVCRTRRGKRVCVCPDGREACGAKCCPETFVCRRTARGKKVCVCPPRTRPCGGRCVPFTDPAHCGGCGRECPPATACVDGQCVGGDGSGTDPGGTGACTCPPGQTCCDGACTDLNTDEAHCGRCDQPCPQGQACCDGECKDLDRDPRNCGECGKSCPSDLVCTNGTCVEKCPPAEKKCGGACCKAGEACESGRCVAICPEGQGFCSGRCVDTTSDNTNCGPECTVCNSSLDPVCCGGKCTNIGLNEEHCGGCFVKCKAGEFCRFGECVCPLGQTCG